MAATVAIVLPTVIASTPNVVGAAGAPAPTVHYTFDNSLTDSAGGSTLTPMPTCPTLDGNSCNTTATFGNDSDGGYWQWTSTAANGGGFRVLTDQVVGDTYTMSLKFSFEQVGPRYKKIIDFLDRTEDTGFYFFSGTIYFYDLGDESSQVYSANEVLDLVVVRQSTGGTAGTFTVYARGSDGVLNQVISIVDPDGQSIPFTDGSNDTLLGFFFDDLSTPNEATTGGKVYDIKIWENTALTPQEIAELFPVPPAPEPPAVDPVVPSFTG